MELLLIRHAQAENPGLPSDAARALTDEGRARFSAEVQGLGALHVRLDAVLHSGLVRAAQTAALLRPLCAGPLEQTPLLAQPPGLALLGHLRARGGDRLALVGHEPWMGSLLSLLISGTTSLASNLPFKKGGVAWLEGEPAPGQMALLAFLPPRTLRDQVH